MTESRTLDVNGQTHFHRFNRVPVPPHFDLLAWLSGQPNLPKVYWKCRETDFEVAAIGSLLTLSEVPLFGSLNDSPARFWGGHAFFPHLAPKDEVWTGFPKIAFFLPQIEVVRKGEQTEAIIHSLGGPIVEEIDFFPALFSATPTNVELEEHSPSSDNWISFINSSLEGIEKASFSKVVAARRSTHTGKVNPLEILSKLKAKGATHFAVQFEEGKTFIGATPERLYRRDGRSLITEAVAGTRKRGSSDEEDLLLEKELLSNEKEKREFAFVKTSIEEGLSPLCTSLVCETEDSVLKTPNVQHLHNRFTGELKSSISDNEILNALHPTAAMGGLPKKSALEHLVSEEPFERGWYASPIGFVSQEKAEFVVGIRSALVEREKIHLFAGTGIVEGSKAETEWEELEHKTALWKGVLT